MHVCNHAARQELAALSTTFSSCIVDVCQQNACKLLQAMRTCPHSGEILAGVPLWETCTPPHSCRSNNMHNRLACSSMYMTEVVCCYLGRIRDTTQQSALFRRSIPVLRIALVDRVDLALRRHLHLYSSGT